MRFMVSFCYHWGSFSGNKCFATKKEALEYINDNKQSNKKWRSYTLFTFDDSLVISDLIKITEDD